MYSIFVRAALAFAAALATCTAPVAHAQPPTFATITPSLSSHKPGAKAALTFTVGYSGGEFNVPSPVRRSVLQFPAGLTLEIPSLRSCSAARLLARGPGGCPAQSELGSGHALAEVRTGDQVTTENVNLWIFLGPLQTGGPTVEILGRGVTPAEAEVVVTGTVVLARPPYGEELVIPVPPIPTLPLEPDASTVAFTLTIGARQHRTRNANTVLVPSSCPAGGFPFAAEFTYADGFSDNTLATVPCSR
jgi:hypothetical protein